MKGCIRYIAALLAMLLLICAAAVGLIWFTTREEFARMAAAPEALIGQQQVRIDARAAELAQLWGVSPDMLGDWCEGAARAQNDAVAAWWVALWNDPEADVELPVYITDREARSMVDAIMQDPGFSAIATYGQKKAMARDEVVYELDEAVCEAVTPLRVSIVNLGTQLAAKNVNLPEIMQHTGKAALALACVAPALLLLFRRIMGSALMATGLSMALLTLPVRQLDIPGMLAQLNPLAAEQGRHILQQLGLVWYTAAAALAVLGVMIIVVNVSFARASERRAEKRQRGEANDSVPTQGAEPAQPAGDQLHHRTLPTC